MKRTLDVGHMAGVAGVGREAIIWREVSVGRVGHVAGVGHVADVGHVGGRVPCAYCVCVPVRGRHVVGVGCVFMLQALAGVCVML
jgi:hypothetical protein